MSECGYRIYPIIPYWKSPVKKTNANRNSGVQKLKPEFPSGSAPRPREGLENICCLAAPTFVRLVQYGEARPAEVAQQFSERAAHGRMVREDVDGIIVGEVLHAPRGLQMWDVQIAADGLHMRRGLARHGTEYGGHPGFDQRTRWKSE